jgi:serine/threonine protein kinase
MSQRRFTVHTLIKYTSNPQLVSSTSLVVIPRPNKAIAPASRPPVARSSAEAARPIKNGLVLHKGRNYDGTIRAIFCSTVFLDSLWYAETKKSSDKSAPDPDPYTWDTPPRLINILNIRPAYTNVTMTSAKYLKNNRLYAKTMDYLRYSTELFGTPYWLKDIVMREIENCETLRKNPHPNICRYRGVDYDLKSKRIMALLFQKYDMTLGELIAEKRTFDAEKCLQDIRQGTRHIHSLGYVHVDIKPSNIFVDLKVQPACFVVGDFDSTQRQGSQLRYKCGTECWRLERARHEDYKANIEQDWYGLEMVEAYIKEKGNAKPVEGRSYPKTSDILKRAKRKFEMDKKAREKQEETEKAVAKKRADAAKRIEALEKADAKRANVVKPAEVAKKASPPKSTALPKTRTQQAPAATKKAARASKKLQEAAEKSSPSPKKKKKKSGAPKKLRIGPP